MTQLVGPRLQDDRFFGELVNTNLPGLEEIPKLAAQKDYAACRKVFAKHVRETLDVERLKKVCGMDEISQLMNDENIMKNADLAASNYLSSTGVPYQFGNQIDWEFNATSNGYVEWTWQLNRHPHWIHLAKAYMATKDEKYAKAWARQFDGWVKQALVPENAYGWQTKCWRTIETGIRSSGCMVYSLLAFYNSPSVSDDVLVDFYKSMWEHGWRLEHDHEDANWLTMEMNGLTCIAVMYPEFKRSEEWYNYAVKIFDRELEEQFYADGIQVEIAASYEYVCILNYMNAIRTAEIYGKPMPQKFLDCIENQIEGIIRESLPDGGIPELHDSHSMPVARILANYRKVFPNNKLIQWAADGRKGDFTPDYTSVAFPYAGIAALRTGWTEKDLYGIFDSGPYGMRHQHQDKLNFSVFANGHYILPECGCYAYDTSDMRFYCLSTRGHNTGRVNHMDQNRQQGFEWDPKMCKNLSDLKVEFTDDIDTASGAYEDGYNNGGKETAFPTKGLPKPDPSTLPPLYKGASQHRTVKLVKKVPAGMQPFFVVIDRFLSNDKGNEYEILWHTDSAEIEQKETAENMIYTQKDLTLFLPNMDASVGKTEVVFGQEKPEFQGWRAPDRYQGEWKKVQTVKGILYGGSARIVTVIYPSEVCPITKVVSSADVADKSVQIFVGDEVIEINE